MLPGYYLQFDQGLVGCLLPRGEGVPGIVVPGTGREQPND